MKKLFLSSGRYIQTIDADSYSLPAKLCAIPIDPIYKWLAQESDGQWFVYRHEPVFSKLYCGTYERKWMLLARAHKESPEHWDQQIYKLIHPDEPVNQPGDSEKNNIYEWEAEKLDSEAMTFEGHPYQTSYIRTDLAEDKVRRFSIKSSEIHGEQMMWPKWEGYGDE